MLSFLLSQSFPPSSHSLFFSLSPINSSSPHSFTSQPPPLHTYLPSPFIILYYPMPVSKWNAGCLWPLWRHCSRFRFKLPGEEYEILQSGYQISWPRTQKRRKHLMKHYQWVGPGLRDWNCMPNASSLRSDVSKFWAQSSHIFLSFFQSCLEPVQRHAKGPTVRSLYPGQVQGISFS